MLLQSAHTMAPFTSTGQVAVPNNPITSSNPPLTRRIHRISEIAGHVLEVCDQAAMLTKHSPFSRLLRGANLISRLETDQHPPGTG